MFQRDFQSCSSEGRWGTGKYERLVHGDRRHTKPVRPRSHYCWMKKMKRRVYKGLRLPRSKKLNWKPFSITYLLSRKIGRIYEDFVKKILKMDEACPAIIFSCQWGLPVLSHSSLHSRKLQCSICYDI